MTDGAANGSMPGWEPLHPNEWFSVSAYVASLRGQNLPVRAQRRKRDSSLAFGSRP